jgi:hypothetical protein
MRRERRKKEGGMEREERKIGKRGSGEGRGRKKRCTFVICWVSSGFLFKVRSINSTASLKPREFGSPRSSIPCLPLPRVGVLGRDLELGSRSSPGRAGLPLSRVGVVGDELSWESVVLNLEGRIPGTCSREEGGGEGDWNLAEGLEEEVRVGLTEVETLGGVEGTGAVPLLGRPSPILPLEGVLGNLGTTSSTEFSGVLSTDVS